MARRFVICFDGTWNRAENRDVSNVEKLARCVRPSSDDGVQQVVHYVGGVGTSYRVDRILGGSLGLGITRTILNAYHFLALNYAAGDTVYVFGFSRGAFAARSLVGMIYRVGLIRSDKLIWGKLSKVEKRYKSREDVPTTGETPGEFKDRYCHRHVCIPFLGVFDTVEALSPDAHFRDVDFLDDVVATGRQALALDERRRIFCPQLWKGDAELGTSGRVRQVWFDGHHSDVGGGVYPTGLPDTSLYWMAAAAIEEGLEFDEDLLADYLGNWERSTPEGRKTLPHDKRDLKYKIVNLAMRVPWARTRESFDQCWRVVAPVRAIGVALSEPALSGDRAKAPDRPNVRTWLGRSGSPQAIDEVLPFPVAEPQSLPGLLLAARQSAAQTGGIRHHCPAGDCDTYRAAQGGELV